MKSWWSVSCFPSHSFFCCRGIFFSILISVNVRIFALIAAQTCFCQVAVFLGYCCAVMDALILLLSSPGVDLANRPCVIELDYEPVISIGLWLMKSKTKPAIAHRNRD